MALIQFRKLPAPLPAATCRPAGVSMGVVTETEELRALVPPWLTAAMVYAGVDSPKKMRVSV